MNIPRGIPRGQFGNGDNGNSQFSPLMVKIPTVAPTVSSSTDEEILRIEQKSYSIDDLLRETIAKGGSDLHLSYNTFPKYRVDGDLISIPHREKITDEWLRTQMQKIMPEHIWESFLEEGEADLAYSLDDNNRFRVNVFKQRGTVAAVLRSIPTKIKSIEELGVPEKLKDLTKLPKGLILVTGVTGSGKALRLDTKIPTPHGATTMGKLSVGDEVIDSQGEPTRVIGMSEINETPDLYRITLSDGQTILADKDHQWIVSGDKRIDKATDEALAIKLMEIASSFDSYETATLNEIYTFVDSLNNSQFYKNTNAIKASLDFMDIIPENKNGADSLYHLTTAIYGLGVRTYQRLDNSLPSDFSVMSTFEIIVRGDFYELKIPTYSDETLQKKKLVRIEKIEKVDESDPEYGPVRCISVDSPDKSYLCADFVVTHNSTTLAAMIDAINSTRQEHIMTIEDPIEFIHPNKKSLVNQREVGTDTISFAEALKRVLRQDPDIILIGELRDSETISTALTAAETGHLVFGTLHTQSAVKTIDRIIDTFPAAQQGQVRSQLADTLQAVIAQTLVKKIGGGRVAATEILVSTSAVSSQIREGKTKQIYNDLVSGKNHGMHTLDQDLTRLVREGIVDKDEVMNLMVDKAGLDDIIVKNNDWSY